MAKKITVEINKDAIVSIYTDYVLTHGKKPNSIYEFAKNNSMEEAEFYKYFASFEALEEQFFSDMLHYTLEMLSNSSDYEHYDASQKLSCFYFTFFEVATANRSFVMHLLQQESMPLKNLMKLKSLRKDFLSYVKTVLDTPYKIENQRITDIQNRVVHEGAWLQFMSILKYWMEDTSASFEKTDVFIEKSVKASFDMVYNVPVESILDFGKFIWKEKFGNFKTSK
ncbi:TetR family transcriptional regulator C-terminal domain-containing protein [Flavobacterium luminosum]|uniref:TetR family transcriptional regulator C-terminal domain-containing protein n=1 Tax=Flavobacterium luminosum TaxID=2949086 RepID=A0ABT0TPS9_9FLAO|nr:TetR family transcriptional regulator C-terminal domain-containing protein [Flavobacterium sp. HXWNR70]MCL9809370.1 TetR family transcriptional regulator C-terminal domain-containing protein [Flavobacterium sp. HXWNR70]